MISVTAEMILKLVASSIALGIISAFLYRIIYFIPTVLATVIRCKKKCVLVKSNKPSLFSQFFDFFTALIIGTAYVLLSYACVDGTFELYSLIAFFLSFAFTKRLLWFLQPSKDKNGA